MSYVKNQRMVYCACAYVCMYVCTYVGMYVCMYACMYVCMHACFTWIEAISIWLVHVYMAGVFLHRDRKVDG